VLSQRAVGLVHHLRHVRLFAESDAASVHHDPRYALDKFLRAADCCRPVVPQHSGIQPKPVRLDRIPRGVSQVIGPLKTKVH
jgi:hypothetical protein